jgi:hypothetical protein
MTPKGAGRAIGVMFIAQMVAGFVVNFVWLAKVFDAPGFLVNAAANPSLMGLCALVGIAAGSLAVAIAITVFPVLRPYSRTWALWFFALAVAGFSAAVVENINLMSLLSLSQAYAKASAVDQQLFQPLRGVVASARNWAHFVGLIVHGSALLAFYSALYRFKLVPRVLAACGVVAVLLQITTVGMPLFGHEVIFPLLAPLGICQLLLSLWLIVKGLSAAGPAESTGILSRARGGAFATSVSPP